MFITILLAKVQISKRNTKFSIIFKQKEALVFVFEQRKTLLHPDLQGCLSEMIFDVTAKE